MLSCILTSLITSFVDRVLRANISYTKRRFLRLIICQWITVGSPGAQTHVHFTNMFPIAEFTMNTERDFATRVRTNSRGMAYIEPAHISMLYIA